jgi:hypothetical protein
VLSSFDEFERAKIANKTTPAITKKKTPFEFFFFTTGFAEGTEVAGLGVLEVEVKDDEPRVGTGGITNFDTSTAFALRFADFFAGRFALRADFFAVRFTARFAGRFAAARFAGRFRAADFFFVAT